MPQLREPGPAASSVVPADPAHEAAPPDEAPKPVRRVAVIVCHGMGQQVRFETLNAVADGLQRAEIQRAEMQHRQRDVVPAVRMVQLEPGEVRAPRVELELLPATGAREVHLYESYWAPLAEGRIRDRDVVGFLLAAGRNGFARGMRAFQRLMFGRVETFNATRWAAFKTWSWFILAFAVFLSLIAIQAVIAAIAAARFFTGALGMGAAAPSGGAGTGQAWPADTLMADLTVDLTVDLAVLLAAAFTMVVAIQVPAALRKRSKGRNFWVEWRPNKVLLKACWAGVNMALVTMVAVAALMLFHIARSRLGAADSWWVWFAGAFAQFLADIRSLWQGATTAAVPDGPLRVGQVAAGILVALFVVYAGSFVWRIAGWLFGVLVVAALVGAGYVAVTSPSVAVVLVWGVAYLASEKARWFFRQYLGDVALHVTPHTLDTFWDVRQAIKDCAARTGRAVYQAMDETRPLYDRVVVVGHSLGSVVAYDMLNELIQEDSLGRYATAVARRTRLFLTFGSPLDKIIYVFGTQRPNGHLVEHALAAAVQPLISSYDDDRRPASWCNIHSTSDWISGDLSYFDSTDAETRAGDGEKCVVNEPDPEAASPLLAHLEYWDGLAFVNTLYRAVTE